MPKIITAQSKTPRIVRFPFGENCGPSGSGGNASSLIRFLCQRRLARTIWRKKAKQYSPETKSKTLSESNMTPMITAPPYGIGGSRFM